MPGWLVRSDRVRAFELVADFLRRSARQAPEEFFQQACDLLRRLWEADGVTLWRLDADPRGLQPLAASAPQGEGFGAPGVGSLPRAGEPPGSELVRLVAALRELDAAEAGALYEREGDKLRQVAAAGAAHWLPTELPLGDARRPWEQALSEARGVTLHPEAGGR